LSRGMNIVAGRAPFARTEIHDAPFLRVMELGLARAGVTARFAVWLR
jgi:hypothetical protein